MGRDAIPPYNKSMCNLVESAAYSFTEYQQLCEVLQ
ncbi:protein of unknown function [Candidatus Promineifilum breve]|uniref:Uncharacterized protein n=1 Tax=Candidatus Promineifilum breve TaxID=1806508 RepID=A0A160T1I8_9CHLR|nr:protein of unknown function [Candidatus Promineifilum breve]